MIMPVLFTPAFSQSVSYEKNYADYWWTTVWKEPYG